MGFDPLPIPPDATYPEWEEILSRGMIPVKCGSHRARQKLERLLGYAPKEYYSFYARNHVYEVPADKLTEALAIKGVTKSRKIYKLSQAWSS
jgi:hypothetical protein